MDAVVGGHERVVGGKHGLGVVGERDGALLSAFTGKPFYQGATLGKNTLGAAVAILTLFLVWDLFQVCKLRREDGSKIEIGNRVVVLLMSIWLLIQADSARHRITRTIPGTRTSVNGGEKASVGTMRGRNTSALFRT